VNAWKRDVTLRESQEKKLSKGIMREEKKGYEGPREKG